MVPFLSSNMQKILWDSHIYFKIYVQITEARTFCLLNKNLQWTLYLAISFVFWKFFLKSQKIFSISDRF